MKGQNDERQQDREPPRGNSSSGRVSEMTSENLCEVPFCDLVFITNVPLGGSWRSSQRPWEEDFLSEALGPAAPHLTAP